VQVEANAATTRAEALRGQRKAQVEETAMDVVVCYFGFKYQMW
jgi:hypothetical protein